MTTCMCVGQFDLRSREGPCQIFTCYSNSTLVVRPGIGYRMVLWCPGGCMSGCASVCLFVTCCCFLVFFFDNHFRMRSSASPFF